MILTTSFESALRSSCKDAPKKSASSVTCFSPAQHPLSSSLLRVPKVFAITTYCHDYDECRATRCEGVNEPKLRDECDGLRERSGIAAANNAGATFSVVATPPPPHHHLVHICLLVCLLAFLSSWYPLFPVRTPVTMADTSIIEVARQTHEEVERYEQALVDMFLSDIRGVSTSLAGLNGQTLHK